jgi:adenine-specific DNA methylase
MNYPKRLIEVDLPIARISAHARREKSIRHGHISTLHIWWARRPLAACRAVILASLWPDPVDLTEWAKEADAKGEVRAPKGETLKPGEGLVIRPSRFLDEARQRMTKWSQIALGKASNESFKLLVQVSKNPKLLDDPLTLRALLLDFIADFADWEHSTDSDYLGISEALVRAAHESLGGEVGTRPTVIDPFAGGGSIPLEALRVGADAFASDLNPIPVLLNKVVLEYIPKYGQRLVDELRKWSRWVKEQAEHELASYYPSDSDGSTPIAYLWARTVLSEAPGQGELPIEVPLLRSLWLAKKATRRRALRWSRDQNGNIKTSIISVEHVVEGNSTLVRVRRPILEVFEPRHEADVEPGTVARGHATCPITGYTTRVDRIRAQLRKRRGGTADARLVAVVTVSTDASGRFYRIPTAKDWEAASSATTRLAKLRHDHQGPMSYVPDEHFTGLEPRRIPLPQYGINGFADLFTGRQMLTTATLCDLIRRVMVLIAESGDIELGRAVSTCLAFVVDRMADGNSSLARWQTTGEKISNTFGRQALPMVWDFCEANPFCTATRSLDSMFGWIIKVCEHESVIRHCGQAEQMTATSHRMPDDSCDAMVTDPPYYYSVPYSDLSDFFYVWLRRCLSPVHPELLRPMLTPKEDECVQNLPHSEVAHLQKSRAFYEQSMTKALSEGRRYTKPDGFGLVVFAHTDTEAWESLLTAVVEAGWCVTSSWPIDTEMQSRIVAQRQSSLASSVHICCRPRESVRGVSSHEAVGEWRELLGQLPRRIEEWMPRLAAEGVVGADAIFACLGPALEIFSRYSRVEKASGEAVTLREYLEHVWAAVSNEALSMIFKDADAAGLEPDARLTAMWLWTLGGGKPPAKEGASGEGEDGEEAENDDEEETTSKKGSKVAGFVLEFDAARKIAQGLGIHLEKSESIVEVKGESARLLPVSERTRHLFGKDAEEDTARTRKAKKKAKQGSLFEELDAIEAEAASTGGRFGGLEGAKPGATVLDKVHQSMILFAAGRGEALKRFLVEDGVGKDGRFWKLAQSLSALYPTGTDEKRWVDGVLARKKGLGF